MAFARDTYTADGSSQTYGLTFPYISRSHVTATVDGTNRTFTWNHSSSITLDSPTLSGGEAIVITRSSNRTGRLVDYNDGATLTESDLDLDSKQALYMAQEAFDAQEVLDASNIADGSVSNTEFQYLDGVTSNIQTQIDAAVAGGGGSMNDVIDDATPQLGGNLDVNGFTVDGRDPSVDGTKLDGIEASATADMSGAEIKAAYEAESNAYTDTKDTKLAGIDTGAKDDQTGGEIKTAYEAELNTNAFTDAEKTLLGNQSGTNTGDEVVATSAEVTTGTNNTKMVTPAAINGSSPALASGTATNTKTDTTGTVYGWHDQTTFSPAASSDAIIVANAGTTICSSTQATTGAGHSVGVLGTGLHNTTTTYPLLVGTEGLIQKLTTGTITEADGLLSHNLGNAGTLTKANGLRCAITGNSGTMDEYNAVQADIVSNTGTITKYNGVLVKDLEEGSGTIGDVVGFKFEDQTDTFGSKKAIEILDADAPIETAGDIIQNGTTSGSITVAAPAVAGSNTITYPADTGTVMLTKDARVLQIVDVTDTTGSSGTTIGWGLDNTIPQTTESDQYLSVAITPQSSTSTLLVSWNCWLTASATDWIMGGIWEDSDTGASAAFPGYVIVADLPVHHVGQYEVATGATDEITFKFRAAKLGAGTLYFNKVAGSSLFGGVMKSFIRVIEFQP